MNAKISIIVPVYNTEKYLVECLNSIKQQTLQEIEVLIVDDGSTDSSPVICDSFARNDRRFTVFHLKNQGVSFARNFGITHANGQYCMFIDSDDWIENNCCELLLKAAIKTDADLIIGAHVNESSKESNIRRMFNEDRHFCGADYRNNILIKTLGLPLNDLKNPSLLDRFTPIWSRLYKTKIINENKIEFYDLAKIPSECLQFNFDYEVNAHSAFYLNTTIYHYRRNTGMSVTKPYRKDLLSKWIHWSDYFQKKYNHELTNDDMRFSFNSRICCSVIPLGGNSVKLKNHKLVRQDCSIFLKSSFIKDAFQLIDFSKCPPHWRLFFYSAKKERVFLFIFLTKVMRKMLKKRKK